MSSSQYNDQNTSGTGTTGHHADTLSYTPAAGQAGAGQYSADPERTTVHEGHYSAGSQILSGGQQNVAPVDLAAETAKFDNAYGAVPSHQESFSSGTLGGASGSHGLTGQTGSHGISGSSGLSGNAAEFQQSSGGAYQGSTEHQHSTHGTTHSHGTHGHSHEGQDHYTGNKSEQREQMKEEKKQGAEYKKEELKERNAHGESKTQIAKDEHNKIAHEADKETPDGHKPGLMDKIKTAVKKI